MLYKSISWSTTQKYAHSLCPPMFVQAFVTLLIVTPLSLNLMISWAWISMCSRLFLCTNYKETIPYNEQPVLSKVRVQHSLLTNVETTKSSLFIISLKFSHESKQTFVHSLPCLWLRATLFPSCLIVTHYLVQKSPQTNYPWTASPLLPSSWLGGPLQPWKPSWLSVACPYYCLGSPQPYDPLGYKHSTFSQSQLQPSPSSLYNSVCLLAGWLLVPRPLESLPLLQGQAVSSSRRSCLCVPLYRVIQGCD